MNAQTNNDKPCAPFTPSQISSLRSWYLFRTSKRKETGDQNAQRFVETVLREAKDVRLIVCRMDSGYAGRKSELCGWIWMPNPRWRAKVLDLLTSSDCVTDFKFTPPDALDGWTFHATSTVPVPRVAFLELDQTL